MVKLETKQDAEQLTRDLLAERLDKALYAALDAGYVFGKAENRALRNVSAWPAERLRKAAEHYERQVRQ